MTTTVCGTCDAVRLAGPTTVARKPTATFRALSDCRGWASRRAGRPLFTRETVLFVPPIRLGKGEGGGVSR